MNKLYSFSYEGLVDSALLFQWLKRKDLVRSHSIDSWGHSYRQYNATRIKFDPSDTELDDFFQKNQKRIFEYMIYDMGPNKEVIDPFLNYQAVDFYHYHQALSQFKI